MNSPITPVSFLLAGRSRCVNLYVKMRTVEAIIHPYGEVLLVEPVRVQSPRRALVTILEEEPQVHDSALLSEPALAEDWNRPEEDAAWAHLQPGKSS
jgi:hypothetical protein